MFYDGLIYLERFYYFFCALWWEHLQQYKAATFLALAALATNKLPARVIHKCAANWLEILSYIITDVPEQGKFYFVNLLLILVLVIFYLFI